MGSFPRRKFLLAAGALGVAACSSVPGARVLGHQTVGSGAETVVVLHEWLGDHTNYDGVVPHLTPDRARWIFADLRGYGLSRDIAGEYTMAEAARDVIALMDRLGHREFHVVGHSMSGMIAQYLMAEYPDRIKSIVAISPVPAAGFRTDQAGFDRMRGVITDTDAFRTAVTARTAGRYTEGWVMRKLQTARRASPEAMVGYLRMFTTTDFSARIVGLETPVTLITGARDIPFYARATLEPLFRHSFPRLQVVTIEDAGHYAMLETPVLLAALLERAVLAEPLLRTTRLHVDGGPGISA